MCTEPSICIETAQNDVPTTPLCFCHLCDGRCSRNRVTTTVGALCRSYTRQGSPQPSSTPFAYLVGSRPSNSICREKAWRCCQLPKAQTSASLVFRLLRDEMLLDIFKLHAARDVRLYRSLVLWESTPKPWRCSIGETLCSSTLGAGPGQRYLT